PPACSSRQVTTENAAGSSLEARGVLTRRKRSGRDSNPRYMPQDVSPGIAASLAASIPSRNVPVRPHLTAPGEALRLARPFGSAILCRQALLLRGLGGAGDLLLRFLLRGLLSSR